MNYRYVCRNCGEFNGIAGLPDCPFCGSPLKEMEEIKDEVNSD